MKEIKLTQGLVAMVDDIDFEYLNQFNWYAMKNRNTFYAVRQDKRIDGKQKTIWMHRVLMNPKKGFFVDHIDRNGINNQRQNLRVLNNAENSQNRSVMCRNSSGITGVSWDKTRSSWQVNIMVNGKNKKVGRYNNMDDAISARKEAEMKYHPFYINSVCQ